MEQQVVATLQAINERGTVTDEAAKVDPCDGSDTAGVKEFLRNLELVPDASREAVVKRVCRASLLRESLEWLQNNAFAFNAFRTHILRTFVSQDTDGVLRRELHKVTRQPGETILAFNRRFRESAANAYPGQHNAEQVEALVRLYAAALHDQALAGRIVSPAWPATLDEALTRVADTERKSDNLVRLGVRTEEAMEVDAFVKRPSPPTEMEKELHLLKTQYGKLEAKLDRLVEALAAPKTPVPTAPRRRGFQPNVQRAPQPSERPAERDERTCYYCNVQGHVRTHCPVRLRDNAGSRGTWQRGNRPPVATASSRQ